MGYRLPPSPIDTLLFLSMFILSRDSTYEWPHMGAFYKVKVNKQIPQVTACVVKSDLTE